MTKKFSVYRSFRGALNAAPDEPILRIGYGRSAVYIVGARDLDEVALLTVRDKGGREVIGHVTVHHLRRLGNANHAHTDAEVRNTVAAAKADALDVPTKAEEEGRPDNYFGMFTAYGNEQVADLVKHCTTAHRSLRDARLEAEAGLARLAKRPRCGEAWDTAVREAVFGALEEHFTK